MAQFEQELKALINKFSQENSSNTPDFILSKYLEGCLHNFNQAVKSRDDWFGYRTASGSSGAQSTDKPPGIIG